MINGTLDVSGKQLGKILITWLLRLRTIELKYFNEAKLPLNQKEVSSCISSNIFKKKFGSRFPETVLSTINHPVYR